MASDALSYSLLILSLLLNSLGIHLMLILMLRARHTDAKRRIWTKKSRDRPRSKQSTVDGLSLSCGILQSMYWLAVSCAAGCFDQGSGFKSEDFVVEKPFVRHHVFPWMTREQERRQLWKTRIPQFGSNYLGQIGRPKQSRRTSPLHESTRKAALSKAWQRAGTHLHLLTSGTRPTAATTEILQLDCATPKPERELVQDLITPPHLHVATRPEAVAVLVAPLRWSAPSAGLRASTAPVCVSGGNDGCQESSDLHLKWLRRRVQGASLASSSSLRDNS